MQPRSRPPSSLLRSFPLSRPWPKPPRFVSAMPISTCRAPRASKPSTAGLQRPAARFAAPLTANEICRAVLPSANACRKSAHRQSRPGWRPLQLRRAPSPNQTLPKRRGGCPIPAAASFLCQNKKTLSGAAYLWRTADRCGQCGLYRHRPTRHARRRHGHGRGCGYDPAARSQTGAGG